MSFTPKVEPQPGVASLKSEWNKYINKIMSGLGIPSRNKEIYSDEYKYLEAMVAAGLRRNRPPVRYGDCIETLKWNNKGDILIEGIKQYYLYEPIIIELVKLVDPQSMEIDRAIAFIHSNDFKSHSVYVNEGVINIINNIIISWHLGSDYESIQHSLYRDFSISPNNDSTSIKSGILRFLSLLGKEQETSRLDIENKSHPAYKYFNDDDYDEDIIKFNMFNTPKRHSQINKTAKPTTRKDPVKTTRMDIDREEEKQEYEPISNYSDYND